MSSYGAQFGDRWRKLSPRCFLAAGVLLFGHAVSMGIRAFSEIPTPVDLFAPLGHLLAVVGVLGLYSVAVTRSQIYARISGFVSVASATAWSLIVYAQLSQIITFLPTWPDEFTATLSVFVMVTTIFAYLGFGTITIAVSDVSRDLGVLVLAPAGLFAIVIASVALIGPSSAVGFVVGSGLTLCYVALGYRLEHASGVRTPLANVAEPAS